MNSRNSRSKKPLLVSLSATCALLLAGGGYVAAVAAAPPIKPTFAEAEGALAPIHHDDTQAHEMVLAKPKPTAVGFAEQDTVWSNDDTAYPLASISKLITVLVCLDAAPLDPDLSTWGTYTWTEADRERQEAFIADEGVAFPMPVGTEIPLTDLFTLIFLPSANDMVTAYAYTVFDSNDAFVTAVHAWAEKNGLDSIEFREPSGMDEGNKASPSDLVRVGRIALKDPVITQFITQESAYVEGAGYVENTNPLLGVEQGILGIKTGRSLSAGFNLLVAQERTSNGRSYEQISATMGRGSLRERADSGREMLGELDKLPLSVAPLQAGELLGTLTDWSGATIEVTAADAATEVTLLPGESVTREGLTVKTPETAENGAAVGTITVSTPAGEEQIDLVTTAPLTQPDLWWRVTHPGDVLFR
ncbi:hypothetical protein [Leucobacter chinensis]|uniref:hypothetical protein n=1 Tax=Leucobacter chinensis TaxID=2851010 RepID=UPI001C23E430|nr:hypothetical protein [Leucobacter chinensis]